MDIAEEILRKYGEVFDSLPERGKGQLRFGRSMLSVSNIAEQYYCEQKLDMESEIPMPPTEQKQRSEPGHEAASILVIQSFRYYLYREFNIVPIWKPRTNSIINSCH